MAFSALYAASNFGLSYLNSWIPPPPPPTYATVADVQSDLNKVVNQTGALQAAAMKFASGGQTGTLADAMTIYNDSQALMTYVDRAGRRVKAVQPCPMSESDAKSLFEKLSSLEPAIGSGLEELRNKKDALAELTRPEVVTFFGSPTELIYGALLTGKGSFINFRAALLDATPLAIRGQAEELGQQIENHFDTTIAWYEKGRVVPQVTETETKA